MIVSITEKFIAGRRVRTVLREVIETRTGRQVAYDASNVQAGAQLSFFRITQVEKTEDVIDQDTRASA